MTAVQESHATHIVGGEFNYEYLGNDSLYVKIKVYRDSLNAEPYFDNPLRVYIYDSSDVYQFTWLVPIPEENLIVPQIDDSCFVEPPNVLVDFVVYEDTLYIPGLTPGYTFAYFRCCRNNNILNIEATDFETGDTIPGELTGAVYPAELPGWTLDNANPEYVTFPPVAICANKQLAYDHSAIDADGDSLVYSLCTPYTGGNEFNVFGQPITQAPPFQEVLFIEPYSLENVMGGIPLAIDPVDGLLTAVPNTLGRFVIAVCTDEYRDGEFLARHRRDFQFNVVDCSRVFGVDFEVSPAPKVDTLSPFEFLFCDSTLTKNFTSIIAEPVPLLWNFGDGTTSDLENPVHTFPDTGRYTVTLIAGPGEVCADTMVKVINVQQEVANAAFEYEQDPCAVDEVSVQFTDVSENELPIVQWDWVFGDGDLEDVQNPEHSYDEAGEYEVSLLIYAANGCCALAEETISIGTQEPIILPDTLAICDGDSIRLPLEFDGDASYSWSPVDGLSDPLIQQPLVLPETNSEYIVTVTTQPETGVNCVRTDTVIVLVEQIIPDIDIEADSVACSDAIFLEASTDFDSPVQWTWYSDADLSDTLAIGPVLDTNQNTIEATYYVEAVSQFCTNVSSFEVIKSFLRLDLQPLIQCGPGDLEVLFMVISPSGVYDLIWDFGDTVLTEETSFTLSQEYLSESVQVTGMNAEGCSLDTSFQIGLFDLPSVTATADPQQVFSGDEVDLMAVGEPEYQFSWSPGDNLSDPLIADPIATVFETTLFEVSVLDTNGCTQLDTVLVEVIDVDCVPDAIFIPNAFTPNGDGLNDVFRPVFEGAESMRLTIYDRWGNEIFSTEDMDAGWDGRVEGTPVSGDSFGYLLDVICPGGEILQMKGNVTVLR